MLIPFYFCLDELIAKMLLHRFGFFGFYEINFYYKKITFNLFQFYLNLHLNQITKSF